MSADLTIHSDNLDDLANPAAIAAELVCAINRAATEAVAGVVSLTTVPLVVGEVSRLFTELATGMQSLLEPLPPVPIEALFLGWRFYSPTDALFARMSRLFTQLESQPKQPSD